MSGSDNTHKKRNNYKLLVDPELRRGHKKLYRLNGKDVPGVRRSLNRTHTVHIRICTIRGGTTASRDRHKLLTHQAFAKAISIHFLSRCFETSCVSREAFLACL